MSEIWNLSTLCRCCHADGQFKSLKLTYQGINDVEIYEKMLQETLGISIWTPPLEASYTICDKCILKLRDATDFKNQVLMCEQKFQVYCKNEQFVCSLDIKVEEEDSESDACHDDIGMDKEMTLDVKKEYSIEVDIKHPIIEEVKNENQPETEGVNVEDKNEKKCEVPKKSLRRKITINRQRYTKSKEHRNKRANLSRSLVIQVDTESGVQFSCKDCGGLYQSKSEIDIHIKSHGTVIKCEYCAKQLKSLLTYKNHLKIHTGKKFQCNFCPKNFATKYGLQDHLNCHTKEKIYTCDICQKTLKYKQTLHKHLKMHEGKNKKKLCDLCGWAFNDIANLNAHIKTVHQKLRPFPCKICGKSYSSNRHLNDHLRVHSNDEINEKFFKCDICDHKLSDARTMKIHRLKHDSKFMCRYCSIIFDDIALRNEHVKTTHREEYTCPICGKILSGKFSLNRHIDDHNGIKKFPCDVCGLKFSQKAVLKRHILRKHNPDADIEVGKTKCDICKRSFKNIVAHMDTHNNRSYACEICGKTYPDNSALNRHKSLKHFGRTFDCEICNKKYLQKSKLNTHKLKVHKIKIEKVTEEGS